MIIVGERDVGIICVVIYDDLALEAWTQNEPKIGFAVERERRGQITLNLGESASEGTGIFIST